MSWSGPRKIGIPSPPYKGTGKKLTKVGKQIKSRVANKGWASAYAGNYGYLYNRLKTNVFFKDDRGSKKYYLENDGKFRQKVSLDACKGILEADDLIKNTFSKIEPIKALHIIDWDAAMSCYYRNSDSIQIAEHQIVDLKTHINKELKMYKDKKAILVYYGEDEKGNTIRKQRSEKWRNDHIKMFEKMLSNLDKGVYIKGMDHSCYSFPSTKKDQYKAVYIHEFGHHVYEKHKDKIDKRLFGRTIKYNEEVDVRKWANTVRSSHNYDELIAESFTLYVNGYGDKLQPKLKAIFDSLKKGNL